VKWGLSVGLSPKGKTGVSICSEGIPWALDVKETRITARKYITNAKKKKITQKNG